MYDKFKNVLSLVQIDICVEGEGSMVNHTGRQGRYNLTENGYHFKHIGHIGLI